MKKLLLIAVSLLSLVACGQIETGNVGVRVGSFSGKVSMQEEGQGFYTAFLSSVDQYSAKEITVDLKDMTPKAGDNLSLEDMDLEVRYIVAADKIADLKVKYTNRSAWSDRDDVWFPAYDLIRSFAREATYTEVAKYDSLEIHKNRDELKKRILHTLQTTLDNSDPGVFKITAVVIRNIKTDSSVEESIKRAVAKNKELEAAKLQIDIAREQAKANRALDASLTDKILRQKELDVMQSAIDNGSKPIVMFGAGNAQPLINIK